MSIMIDEEKCIGCSACVDDCVARNLVIEDGVVRVLGRCILCGHCVAICPTEAVSIPSYDMAEVEASVPAHTVIEPALLLKVIKSRRSIRDYLPRKIEPEKLKMLLQAGRYTATAKNAQDCHFVIVQHDLETLKAKVWGGLDALLALPAEEKPRWAKFYRGFCKNRVAEPPVDFLFRNAPAVMFVACDGADDAGLAAQNMELMAASLGLGMLYDGYLCTAVQELPEVKAWLEVSGKTVQLCALLGYPAMSFPRTAPRKAGNFLLK